ncbi:MAG TPA: MFS transporter [Bryobacteraceae bacterium]|nr:MFS transporter [Bryobacteraceae bacterium]
MTQGLETQTIRTVFIRLMPLLMACYLLAYLDRINIGFAAVTMNHDLHLDAYYYGLGAGLFFWGYFFFEVPSNLMLERFGARRWIARIMVTWGLVSMGTAFIQGRAGFLALRFILGVAEAGLFPGVILYLTYWFPAIYRGRIIAAFMVAIPLSLAVGSPISTAILAMGGIAGFKGWQWLFLIEGAPTILLAVIVLLVLPDRPRDAGWLAEDQKQWLEETLDREQKAVQSTHGVSFWRTFIDPRVLGLSFIYFANLTTNLGLAFFLPQMIKEIGFGTVQSGLVTSIPYVLGAIGALAWGYVSDRYNERRISLFLALVVSAVGLAGAGFLGNTLPAVAWMSVAAIGIYGAKAPFWPLPSMFLTGSAAAGGIALINSVGNLGGFAGPYIMGWVKDATGSFKAGLYVLAGFGIAAAIVTLMVVRSAPRPAERSTQINEAHA